MLQHNPQKRLNIDQLANHNFLMKNVKDFKELDLKRAGEKVDKDNLTINTKESIWGIFESSIKDLDQISSKDISKKIVNYNGESKGISGEVVDTVGDLTKDINNLAVESKYNNDEKSSQKSSNTFEKINLTDDKKKNILKAFDDMNADFFYLEPMLIPIVPNTEQKALQLDI